MSVTQTHTTRHTRNKQKQYSGTQINSVLLGTWRTAHTAAYITAMVAGLVIASIIICKFTSWSAVWHFD